MAPSGHDPPPGRRRSRNRRHPSVQVTAQHRADHRDAERLADLAAGGGEPGRHARPGARGMPDTAELVIGALTRPNPMPKTRRPGNSRRGSGVAVSRVISSPAAMMRCRPAPAGCGCPRAATIRPDSGAQTAITSAIGSRNSPAVSARVAADVLQVQRVQEQEPAQRGDRAHRGDASRRRTARCGRTAGRSAARRGAARSTRARRARDGREREAAPRSAASPSPGPGPR